MLSANSLLVKMYSWFSDLWYNAGMLIKEETNAALGAPWYKRGWVVFGLILSFFVVLGLLSFAVKVFGYYQDIKHGVSAKDFLPISEPTAEMKMQNTLAVQQRAMLKNLIKGKDGEPFAGDKNSVNEIVVFVDYGCPYCKMTVGTIMELKSERPDIKISIRDFPIVELHPNAVNAAKSARCVWSQGGSDVYWRYHELLYNRQEKHDQVSLRDYVREVGADLKSYDSCINQSALDSLINQSIMDAETAGVSATPTFFVNGIKLEGVYDADKLLKLID